MDAIPKPVLYDEKGQPLSSYEQLYTDEQWADWQREAMVWNFMKANPYAVGADLFVQYRFSDNTTWKPIINSEGYVIGYSPIE